MVIQGASPYSAAAGTSRRRVVLARSAATPSCSASMRWSRLRRRVVLARSAATAAGWAGALAAGCTPKAAPASTTTGELRGTFDFTVQNFQPTINIIEKAIPAFEQKFPGTKITYTPVAFADMATKVKAATAAGAGPDGFHTYTGFWRGTDAATFMLPLTPTLFKRAELDQLFFPNVLTNAVWSKKPEIYIMPFAVGVNGSMLLWNSALTNAAGVDPRRFTALDHIVEGGRRLTIREGADIKQAGLLAASHTNLVMRWIMDQGGRFYDEKTYKWTWQTVEAERALQWLLDLYDKHAVSWRQNPPGVSNPLGEQRAAMHVSGAFSLSGYLTSHPEVYPKLVDQPMPGFVPGKAPNYYEHEYSGYAITSLLKPDDVKARIGAAFYKELLSPDWLIARANEYSGAILAKAVYADPRFKDTTFGAVRAKLPEQIISKLVFMTMAVRPEEAQAEINKVIAGQTGIKAALAELQQQFSVKEEEARRTMQ
jgi:ABC-type glycerol-3-phosphate transport system substrate-binding protein